MPVFRVCPGCLGVRGPEVTVCDCGQNLSTLTDTDSSQTCEVVRAQVTESHYEEYYALRLQQAQAHLRTLVGEHGTGGWSPSVKRTMDIAIHRVDSAKQELKNQRMRTDEIHAANRTVSNRISIRQIAAVADKKW